MDLGHWIFWLGAGSIISVIVASCLQSRTRKSSGWRFFVCCIFACALTPTLIPAYSHGMGLGIAPAVLVLLLSVLSLNLFFFVFAALPIFIVASVLFCFWYVQIDVAKLDRSKKDVFRCYQCKGIIEPGQEECPTCHWSWK